MEIYLAAAAIVCALGFLLSYRAWRGANERARNYKLEIITAMCGLKHGIQEQNRHSHAAANACFRGTLDGLETTLASEWMRSRRKRLKVTAQAKEILARQGKVSA